MEPTSNLSLVEVTDDNNIVIGVCGFSMDLARAQDLWEHLESAIQEVESRIAKTNDD